MVDVNVTVETLEDEVAALEATAILLESRIAFLEGTAPPNPGNTTAYSDNFNSITLNPRWRWVHEDPSKWSLTIDPGRLRLNRAKGHGFYLTPAYQNQTQVPILYLDPVTLNNGFEVTVDVGYYEATLFGQTGIVVTSDNPLSVNGQLDNYIKVVLEFNISQQLVIVHLIETNGADVRDAENLISVPWSNSTPQVQLNLRYIDGNWVSRYRAIGSNTWLDLLTSPANITVGTQVYVCLYSESDQISSDNNDGSLLYSWVDNFSMTPGNAYVPPADPTYDINADFSSNTLPSGLVWQNEPLTPTAWAITGGKLRIPLVSADMFGGTNGAVPFLYYSLGNGGYAEGMVLEAEVTYSEALPSANAIAGIMLTSGTNGFDNYTKLFYNYSEGRLIFLQETGGSPDFDSADFVFADLDISIPRTLRLERTGAGEIIASYRPVGSTGAFAQLIATAPRNFIDPVRAGLVSHCFGSDQSDKFSLFDNLKIKKGQGS